MTFAFNFAVFGSSIVYVEVLHLGLAGICGGEWLGSLVRGLMSSHPGT